MILHYQGGGKPRLAQGGFCFAPTLSPVILSAAKNPACDEGFFAAISMTGTATGHGKKPLCARRGLPPPWFLALYPRSGRLLSQKIKRTVRKTRGCAY